MAVHGTRRGESVSWDYEGLLQLLSGLARERAGLPVLRCYWYEATVDGRRTAEQDALADVPGIKLRVAKIRPGRREGVETEIHRDLTTLARNNAISDALVVSAEEDLAQVIADVQDLGMRVTLVHIAVDGNWTISRALRQESDDIIEISGEHLRPYVELIAGAEPVHPDEDSDLAAARPLANGHSTTPAASYQQAPAASGNHAPPAIYTAPVVAEYQRPALQLPRMATREPREGRDARDGRDAREDRARDGREDRARDGREDRARDDRAREERTAPSAVNGEALPAARQDIQARQDLPNRPDIYAAPATSTRNRPEPAPQNPEAGPVTTGPEATQAPPGQLRRLPSSRTAVNQGQPAPMGISGPVSAGQHAAQGHTSQGHTSQGHGGQSGQGHSGQGGHGGQGGSSHGGHSGQGVARSSPFSGPQPVLSPAASGGYQTSGGVALSEAVQAAHDEGQEFGGSVARDAPALWLEAVLARKPRMPSDLEARLLQGSALPIDFLLHDEVRHALRRGFWDALERTRR